jgi:Spy/CpxP family protein refolding chaperone
MHQYLSAVRPLLLAAGIALAVPLTAHGQPVPDDFEGVFWGPLLAGGPGPAGPMVPGPGGGAHWPQHGCAGPEDPMPPMLRGLSLTEAQRDKVFAILHAQAPLQREKFKVARGAQEALLALTTSILYDQAKARSLADAGARALGELSLLRANAGHEIYLAMTDAQREQLELTHRFARKP